MYETPCVPRDLGSAGPESGVHRHSEATLGRDAPNAWPWSLSKCRHLVRQAIQIPVAIPDGDLRFDLQALDLIAQRLQIGAVDRPASVVCHALVVDARERHDDGAAMSAPLTYGIATNAKNADCAAFFFDWVARNETARQINVDIGGSNPGGPTDLPIPTAASGSVTNETLAAGNQVAKDNGGMDFIANATGSIFAQGWTPELQKMIGGKQDAAGILKAVQAEYEKELSR